MYPAPQQITPGQSFDISYFIRNHTDAGTYYVRARIYDVKTGALLSTVNLSQSSANSRLFVGAAQAPADPTGYGRAIVAIATVYTDSGYTTRSDNYEEQEQSFLVKTGQLVLGGGGAVDLGGIREMLREELKKLPKPDKPAVFPTESLFGALGALQREVNRIPKDEFDAKPILQQIKAVADLIRAIPEPEKLDLKPVLAAIEKLPAQIQATVREAQREIKLTGAAVAMEIESALKAMSQQIIASADKGLKELYGKQELTIPLEKLFKPSRERGAPMPEEDPRASVSHLM